MIEKSSIDVFDPKLDKTFVSVIKEFAVEKMFDENWINSTGIAFVHELPSGWKDRTVTVFQGNSLTVKILGRSDLMSTLGKLSR